MDRRKFLGLTAGGLAASLAAGNTLKSMALPSPQQLQPDFLLGTPGVPPELTQFPENLGLRDGGLPGGRRMERGWKGRVDLGPFLADRR